MMFIYNAAKFAPVWTAILKIRAIFVHQTLLTEQAIYLFLLMLFRQFLLSWNLEISYTFISYFLTGFALKTQNAYWSQLTWKYHAVKTREYEPTIFRFSLTWFLSEIVNK